MKLIGCGLIIFSAFLRMHFFRKQEKRAISELQEYIKLIDHTRLQIEYFSLPFKNILEIFHSPLWNRAEDVQNSVNMSALSPGETEVINEWIRSIGNGYKSEQLKLCAYAKEKLDGYLNVRTMNYPSKIKTNGALTILGGASLIIFLL